MRGRPVPELALPDERQSVSGAKGTTAEQREARGARLGLRAARTGFAL